MVPHTAVVRGHWCDATASGDKIAGRHFLAALHSSLEFYVRKEQRPILVLEGHKKELSTVDGYAVSNSFCIVN